MPRLPTYFLIFLLCSIGAAQAQEDTLTLEKTLSYVHKENPTILAAQYDLQATEELYPQARSGWLPKIEAETNIISTDIESGNFNRGDGATTKGASVNIQQSLFRGFRTEAEMQAAEHRIGTKIANLKRTQQQIFLQTVESYMDVIRDRLLLSLQLQNKALLDKERESVAARFDAGDITKTDVKQTEARYSKALADYAVAQSDLQESEAVFEKITGLWPPDMMAMPVVPFTFPATLDDLVKVAALQNPSLIQSRAEHRASERDIKTARSDFYPQVGAFASHVKEYDPQPGIVPDSETSTIGLRAKISLYEGGNTLSRVRQAKARASQQFVKILETEKDLKGKLITDWRRLQAFETEITARELEVAAARFSSEGVREEARLGERTVLDMLEAEQEVLDAQSMLVQARRDMIVTSYMLAASLGLLTPEKLGLAE